MAPSPSPSLAAVEAHFAEWRRHRTHRHTPVPLKAQAVALLGEHRIGQVCKHLRINHAMLTRWQQDLAPAQPPNGFIPLPLVVAPPPTVKADRARLTLTRQRPDGESVSIEGDLNEAQWAWALNLLQAAEA